MIDVNELDDAALGKLVRDLERDVLAGVETTFAGEPIMQVWRVAATAQVRSAQRRSFREMSLEQLLRLRDESPQDYGLDVGRRIEGMWQARMGLLREDVENEIASRSRGATGGEA